MATVYPDDAIERTDATLKSLNMDFMGYDSTASPIYTTFSSLRTAIVPDYILIRDKKTVGTTGGSYTSGTHVVRDLTEITNDAGSHASLSTNQFTLAAGTYSINAIAPMLGVDYFQAWLYNVSDSTIDAVGTSSNSPASLIVSICSEIKTEITFSSPKTFEIRQQANTTNSNTWALGTAAGFGGFEIYTVVQLYKTA